MAGPGVKASLLTTVQRSDGDPQVMYNRHPLYTDARSAQWGLKPDKKPGDIKGQRFLQIWFVLSPQGRAIKKYRAPRSGARASEGSFTCLSWPRLARD